MKLVNSYDSQSYRYYARLYFVWVEVSLVLVEFHIIPNPHVIYIITPDFVIIQNPDI